MSARARVCVRACVCVGGGGGAKVVVDSRCVMVSNPTSRANYYLKIVSVHFEHSAYTVHKAYPCDMNKTAAFTPHPTPPHPLYSLQRNEQPCKLGQMEALEPLLSHVFSI